MRFELDYLGREGEVLGAVTKWRLRYKVFTDSASDNQVTILLHPDCPKWGTAFSVGGYTDPLAYCNRVYARPDGGKNRISWIVEAEYERSVTNITQADPDPRNRPAVVTWDSEPSNKIMTQGYLVNDDGSVDALGGITNSAGDPPLDPPEIPYDLEVMIVDINLASFDTSLARQFANKVNDIEWLGFPAFTLLCKPIKSRTEYVEIPNPSGGEPTLLTYYPTQFRFVYDPETWDKQFQDAGMRYLDITGFWNEFTDKYGNPVSSPARLAGDGTPLDNDAPYTDTKYRRYRPENFTVDFNLLDLFVNGGNPDG
jgi:hypothetical protein